MKDMWKACLKGGMSAHEFWDSTLAEAIYYLSSRKSDREEKWHHTSSLMSLYANSKSKNRKFSPDDFNPYVAMAKAETQPKNKEDVNALVEKMKQFNGK